MTAIEIHKAEECAVCGEKLGKEAKFEARTGLYVLDIKMCDPGLEVGRVKHLYGDGHCDCGHVTRTEPGRCEQEEDWQGCSVLCHSERGTSEES